jgi:hypothetical protein
MEFKNTSHQTARSTMPDAEMFNKMYLIKNVSRLRATYQIRLLAFRAVQTGTKLILKVPVDCIFAPSLNALIKATQKVISRENY